NLHNLCRELRSDGQRSANDGVRPILQNLRGVVQPDESRGLISLVFAGAAEAFEDSCAQHVANLAGRDVLAIWHGQIVGQGSFAATWPRSKRNRLLLNPRVFNDDGVGRGRTVLGCRNPLVRIALTGAWNS
ncbi:hypothetical protein CPI13_06080, partial [Moraxella catarrhalis]|nr:hypothetical protein [Moraxella catarrhalis]